MLHYRGQRKSKKCDADDTDSDSSSDTASNASYDDRDEEQKIQETEEKAEKLKEIANKKIDQQKDAKIAKLRAKAFTMTTVLIYTGLYSLVVIGIYAALRDTVKLEQVPRIDLMVYLQQILPISIAIAILTIWLGRRYPQTFQQPFFIRIIAKLLRM